MAACILVVIILGLLIHKEHNEELLATIDDVATAVWGKDGQTLFYTKYEDTNALTKFDIKTRQSTRYVLPEFSEFDISPDEKAIVTDIYNSRGTTEYVNIIDLETKSQRTIYTLDSRGDDSIHHCYWLANGQILVYIGRKAAQDIYFFDKSGQITGKRSIAETSVMYPSIDGRLFFVKIDDKNFYLLNIDTGARTILPFFPIQDNLLYLSNEIMIYRYGNELDRVDLSTMRTTEWMAFDDYYDDVALAPDLQHYYTLEPGGTFEINPEPSHLRIYALKKPSKEE